MTCFLEGQPNKQGIKANTTAANGVVLPTWQGRMAMSPDLLKFVSIRLFCNPTHNSCSNFLFWPHAYYSNGIFFGKKLCYKKITLL